MNWKKHDCSELSIFAIEPLALCIKLNIVIDFLEKYLRPCLIAVVIVCDFFHI